MNANLNVRKNKKGGLYLIPTPLGDEASIKTIPPQVIEIINQVDVLLSEKAKTTRTFLKRIPLKKPIQEFDIQPLNLHTKKERVEEYANLLQKGKIIGIVSEAGSPGVADPGSRLVRLAHHNNIEVVPLVGPSSILLALMASGLSGQNFAFIGYLPKERQKRIKRIIELEEISSKNNQTQIFMETPYRSHHLFNDLVGNLRPNTDLTVAADLTLPTQFIATRPVSRWRKAKKDVHLKDRHVVFLIYRGKHLKI